MQYIKSIVAGLAPMAGFTDMPFREMCSDFGASYCVSEMISSVAICFGDKKSLSLSDISGSEAPCAIQIFGHDPGIMAEASEIILTKFKSNTKSIEALENSQTIKKFGLLSETDKQRLPAAIEINMGCPVRKIVSSGDGSALMKKTELAAEIVKRVYDVTSSYNIPLWVKIRAGWDKFSINAPYFAALMAESGACRITVHGRTREMMYTPSSDNEIIREVRKGVPDYVEVIGNGDVCNIDSALKMLNETSCSGILIGRAALGNPWIFKEISEYNKGIRYTPPGVDDRIRTAIELTEKIVELKGEKIGVREARGRAAHFIRGIKGSAQIRDSLNHADTLEEFSSILQKFMNTCDK